MRSLSLALVALSLAAPGAKALTLSPPPTAPAGDQQLADDWGGGRSGGWGGGHGGGGWTRPDSWGRNSWGGGGKHWNSDKSWWSQDRNRWDRNRWDRNERWDNWRWPINNVTYRNPNWVRPGWQDYRPWGNNSWYGPNYWNNWGWWGTNSALWGLGALATTAVITSAVNSAINSSQPTIAVPNTSYQLYYGSVNAESNNVVSFVVSRNGRNYQMAADCADGELNGHAPVTPAEAELLNSACQVAFSR